MTELIALLAPKILEYGILGIITLIGWGLAGFLLWREYKRKESSAEKDRLLDEKDRQIVQCKEELARKIEFLSKERIDDYKDLIADYNDVASSTIHTLDKLTTALHVVKNINDQ